MWLATFQRYNVISLSCVYTALSCALYCLVTVSSCTLQISSNWHTSSKTTYLDTKKKLNLYLCQCHNFLPQSVTISLFIASVCVCVCVCLCVFAFSVLEVCCMYTVCTYAVLTPFFLFFFCFERTVVSSTLGSPSKMLMVRQS